MINILERQFDPTSLTLRWASPLDSAASRLAKKIKERPRILAKFLGIAVTLLIFAFGLYLYKLHSLAVEGNSLFGYRCANVNPPLIGYKNSFLKFVDAIRNPRKYADTEVKGFYGSYISGMRSYAAEEDKWLAMQQKYVDRWDFQFFMPSFMEQKARYQLSMYQSYRDDAVHMLDLVDHPDLASNALFGYSVERQTRDLNIKIYGDFNNELAKSRDWRIMFLNLPYPKECNPENLSIPDTSGSMD